MFFNRKNIKLFIGKNHIIIMSEIKEEITKDVKFANWNSWYTDLTEQIKETRNLGYIVLFDPKQVNHYYSKIVNLFSTIKWAIDDSETIAKQLQEIEDNIFSSKYLTDLQANKKITKYQRIIIKKLRVILQKICSDLSDGGLLPKVERTAKDNRPGFVRNT